MIRHVLILALLAGCAAPRSAVVEYDPSLDLTVFTSGKIILGRVNMSTGLASGQRVTMQAAASCEGRACEPAEYVLIFLNDSGTDLNLDYRRVRLTFSGRELDWEDLGRVDEPEYYGTPRGEFIRVPLSASDFRSVATAQDLEVFFGRTSTVRFTLSFDRLEPLRDLITAATVS